MIRRLYRWLLCASVGMVVAGCAPEGSYRLQWAFSGAGGSEEPAPIGCGAHGVDSVRIEAVGSEGKQDAIVPCTEGVAVRKILAATWGFNIHALGPDGGFKEPLPGEEPPPGTPPPLLHVFLGERPIPADQETDLGKVVLQPQPACRDGVDNDRDGRSDTDDPDCLDAEGPSESGLPLAP